MGFWQIYGTSTYPNEVINCFSNNQTLVHAYDTEDSSTITKIIELMIGIEILASFFLPHQRINSEISTPTDCDYYTRTINLPNCLQREKGQVISIEEYSPSVFHFFRALVGIQVCDFTQSLGITSFMGNFLLGNFSLYSQHRSPGKSGSSFFTTWDERFLLKSIPEREAQSIRRILPTLCQVNIILTFF